MANTLKSGDVAAFLDHLAATQGDRAFARAASVLRQQAPGRSQIDDRAALEEVDWLMKHRSLSAFRACDLVARRLVTRGASSSVRSIAERLRLKLRKLKGKG